MGVEPATYALRVRCSTTELHRPIYKQSGHSGAHLSGRMMTAATDDEDRADIHVPALNNFDKICQDNCANPKPGQTAPQG